MKKHLLSTTLLLVAVLSGMFLFTRTPIVNTAKGDNDIMQPGFVDKIRNLDATIDKGGGKFLEDTGADLGQILQVLMSKLNSTNLDEKCYAVYLLGEFRFEKSAEALAQRITLQDKIRTGQATKRSWYWANYPAGSALIKIGNPSVPFMIRNLTESDDHEVRTCSLMVLFAIEKDKDVVYLRIRKAMNNTSDSVKKARLESALQPSSAEDYAK